MRSKSPLLSKSERSSGEEQGRAFDRKDGEDEYAIPVVGIDGSSQRGSGDS